MVRVPDVTPFMVEVPLPLDVRTRWVRLRAGGPDLSLPIIDTPLGAASAFFIFH